MIIISLVRDLYAILSHHKSIRITSTFELYKFFFESGCVLLLNIFPLLWYTRNKKKKQFKNKYTGKNVYKYTSLVVVKIKLDNCLPNAHVLYCSSIRVFQFIYLFF